MHLAVRGFLKITLVKNESDDSDPDYILQCLKSPRVRENKFDQKLMDNLFVNSPVSANGAEVGSSVRLSTLKNNFLPNLSFVKDDIYAALLIKGYFVKNPSSVRAFYIAISVAAMFGSIIAFGFWGYLGIASVFASGFITGFFGFFMPAKTSKGSIAKEHIKGLKLYLSHAEKARLEFANDPNKDPKRFERLLPYAMALGVVDQWAKQFEGIYNSEPEWYSGTGTGRFSSTLFCDHMNTFSDFAGSALVPPAMAAGGGSGFGGGGSGGGFGGGGGGSW